MRYVLRKMVLASVPILEITKDEYNAVKPAREVINELIAVEEKYDALMENYVELEETIHNLGIRALAFQTLHYEEMAAPLNLVSRRLTNLLSSTRLYRDALPQHVARLLERKHPAVQPFLALKTDSPKHPMPFRQMEEARNYSQHTGPVINNITFKHHKDLDECNETSGFSISVVPHMDAEGIAEGRDMAEDVRAAFRSMDEQANPMPLVRKYVEHFGTIHASFREAVRQIAADKEAVLRGLLSRYAEVAPTTRLMGVAAVLEKANGSFEDAQYLLEERLDYFKYLRIKHLTAVNLAKRYVPW